MISSDPGFRTERLEALRQALVGLKAGDRNLPAAFVDAVFPELPDGFVCSEPSELAGWIADAYDFVVHTVPPAFQVYRGSPGLHVRARNPDDEDVTVVDTHTAHVPFIFESLRNYFQQQGLRVISAIHPLFTVQRQWERIVRIADAGGEGTRELYCQFRIERLESRERLRRIEHQVHAVLKSVFLAVEDFPAMRRSIQETGKRLRGRDGVPGDPGAGRAFLDWLVDDNFVLFGTLDYQGHPQGGARPIWSTGRGVCRDANLLPVVFPGLMDRLASYGAPAADDGRTIEVEYCPSVSAIHHLEPLEIIAVREWPASDAGLSGATVIVGRFAKSAFSARPRTFRFSRAS